MYQNVPLPKKTAIRLPKIKQGLRDGLNYDQIAANCGLKSSQTIDRDMKAWIESGLFEIWLITEYIETHYYMKNANKSKVYDNLTRIISRMVTQKRELKVEENIREIQLIWHVEPSDKIRTPRGTEEFP
jgi:hypothetical protein